MTDQISQRRWETVCENFPNYAPALVHDFYRAQWQEEVNEVLVRGHTVAFSSTCINNVYELRDIPDAEGNALLNYLDDDFLNTVLLAVARPGAKWDGQGAARTLKSQLLDFEVTCWMHWVKNHTMPTTHDATLSIPRVVLVYCITKGIPLDLGKILVDTLRQTAAKPKGAMFCPGLVTRLCRASDLQPPANEEIRPMRKDFDNQWWTRVTRTHSMRQQGGNQ